MNYDMRLKKIELKPVNKSDLQFLYDLLLERDSKNNISHKKIPSFYNHKKFVFSKPYRKWYIIYYNKEKIGSIYLSKQDEIGISLQKKTHNEKISQKALESIIIKNPRRRFLANISPLNVQSKKFFKKNGFKLIQCTYELVVKT